MSSVSEADGYPRLLRSDSHYSSLAGKPVSARYDDFDDDGAAASAAAILMGGGNDASNLLLMPSGDPYPTTTAANASSAGFVEHLVVRSVGSAVAAAAAASAGADYDDSKYLSKLTPFEDIGIGIFMLFIGCLALMLNFRLLASFWKDRKTLQPPEYFLVNLCVADLITILFAYPLSNISFYSHRWIWGEIGCIYYGSTSYFSAVAGIFSLMAVAVMRYVKTCRAEYGMRLTSSVAKKSITFIYVYSLMWTLPPILGWGSYDVEPYGLSCTLNWWSNNIGDIVQIVLACVLICFVPAAVMVFCYSKILITVGRANRRMATYGINKSSKAPSEKRLTIISATLCLGMMVGWFPYTVVSLVTAIGGKDIIPVRFTVIPVLMAKCSHGYNPLIYFMMVSDKRFKANALLRCVGRVRRSSSTESNAQDPVTQMNRSSIAHPSPTASPKNALALAESGFRLSAKSGVPAEARVVDETAVNGDDAGSAKPASARTDRVAEKVTIAANSDGDDEARMNPEDSAEERDAAATAASREDPLRKGSWQPHHAEEDDADGSATSRPASRTGSSAPSPGGKGDNHQPSNGKNGTAGSGSGRTTKNAKPMKGSSLRIHSWSATGTNKPSLLDRAASAFFRRARTRSDPFLSLKADQNSRFGADEAAALVAGGRGNNNRSASDQTLSKMRLPFGRASVDAAGMTDIDENGKLVYIVGPGECWL